MLSDLSELREMYIPHTENGLENVDVVQFD